MHTSAMNNGQRFFETYASAFSPEKNLKIVEIGSQDVNGSLRSVAPSNFAYVGVDFVAGKGVDIILDDPYTLPFENDSVDMIVSSSCFEHSEMFWLVFLEVMRVLKPKGLFYLNVPSNGIFHRYPVDCWRFYPDSGRALITWARRNAINAALLESYISKQTGDGFNDFVAVFIKDEKFAKDFQGRILDKKTDIYNGVLHNEAEFLKPAMFLEDQQKLQIIAKVIDGRIKV